VGVEEKFICQNVTKQMQHGDWVVAAELWPGSHFCSCTAYNAYDAYAEPGPAESFDSARIVLNGGNMLGLCDPSNLLFEYSFYPPRSDALYSNYIEDLLSKFRDNYFTSILAACRGTVIRIFQPLDRQRMIPCPLKSNLSRNRVLRIDKRRCVLYVCDRSRWLQ